MKGKKNKGIREKKNEGLVMKNKRKQQKKIKIKLNTYPKRIGKMINLKKERKNPIAAEI